MSSDMGVSVCPWRTVTVPDLESRCTSDSGRMYLSRFDGPSRLLARALLSGASGAHRALSVYRRQQRAKPDTEPLGGLIDTLCQDEVTAAEAEAEPLTAKPLVCLFPASFKQNLLSFIYLVHSAVSATSVLRLLKCLSRDTRPNTWVTALGRQLERSLGVPQSEPLCSAQCSQRVRELSAHLLGSAEEGGWAMCFGSGAAELQPHCELSSQRKRKCGVISLDSDDEDVELQAKRTKTDDKVADDPTTRTDTPPVSATDAPSGNPAAESTSDALPEHIKASALQMKELLESQTEWDQSSADVFRVLNDCNPHQVELLCKMLRLSDLPEQTLPKLCSSILALSPDLSYSTAAVLIRSFLLQKVLSLSEPASRCLVTAVTSLCGHYPRPVCHALIGPVLEAKDIGPPQAELLHRLIEGCLDSHYRLMVLQMTFKISWSEAVLTVIHSLLDSKPDLKEELFTQFIEQLVSQCPSFTKSVKFAKMMLTVLTKYNSHITPEVKHSLSACLMLNESFLKKSLQAALKRITHS